MPVMSRHGFFMAMSPVRWPDDTFFTGPDDMSSTNPSVDGYIRKHKQWQDILAALRAIMLDCHLVEEIKWRSPAYTFQGANLTLMGTAKDYVSLAFLKGVLLKDELKILQAPGENSRIARMIKFTDVAQVHKLQKTIRQYVLEAIELEKAGVKVDLEKGRELPIPEELQQAFDADSEFESAFYALTPGRQRSWIIHINGAKQSATRVSRIEKARPKIFDGLGMNERP